MRPDKGGPTNISGAGRGPLSFGERKALEMQRKNRSTAGNPQAISDDPGGLKRTKHVGAPWLKDPRGQG